MTFEIRTYAEVLKPKPRVGYLVDKILPTGALSIWYGYPGSLKSNIVMDMAMAIATGSKWLPALPGTPGNFLGYDTVQTPVLWIDLDNGEDVTEERIKAFGAAYGADASTEFFYMPYPIIQAVNPYSMGMLYEFIAGLPIVPRLIIIDTLLRAARVRDENSSEMDTVMYNIRKLAEDLKATLNLISHSNKNNIGRAANALRGHSSIEGGVDFVFRVEREGNTDLIEIKNEKSRRKPVKPFSARWTYDSDPISDELTKARFYFETGVKVSKQQQAINTLMGQIRSLLENEGKMNKSEIYSRIRGSRPTFEKALAQAIDEGHITEQPGLFNNSKVYEAV